MEQVWDKFEAAFEYPDLLSMYKEIYMKELDSESRKSFMWVFKKG